MVITALVALAVVAPPLVVELAARVSAYPDDRLRHPQPSTVVLDRDGHALASYTADDGRWYLPLEQGAHGRWLPLAVEAVEDARFRSHAGVDWFAAYAAVGQNAMAGRVVRGSSTITMQVERLRYKKVHGRIANNGVFLQLVIGDPWFDWLRPMGQMVLLIDERMEDKNAPLGVNEGSALLNRSRELLRADANGDAFQRLYYQALQLSPELALLHGQVSKTHRS